MVTIVVIVVLVLLAAGAIALVPLMNASTRKGQAAMPVGPSPGSPAQVWCSRGERVLRELNTVLAGAPALDTVSMDAAQVLTELRLNAAEVAELDTALARSPGPELEQQRDRLAARLRTAGPEAREELARAHESATARLALAERQRASRDALLARMEAAVHGLEQARDEVSAMIADGARALQAGGGDAQLELSERLGGLRAGLIEVRELSDPEDDPPSGRGEDRGQP